MGDVKGFLKVKRLKSEYRPACERVKDYREVSVSRKNEYSKEQASRCMDCGTPFCHWGCPVGNYIPEWNDLLFRGKWEKAITLLDATNNLPEITGRLCPALCESACVLGINDDPVTIRENELAIIEYGFSAGIIKPNPPKSRTGKKIAVIGSGPAGLSCADQLNSAGHKVTVFERDDLPGGILRYGIPDFKLEKWVLDRRINILKAEGIEFITGVNVGVDYAVNRLRNEFDSICLAGGSRLPRDLNIEGRHLEGIHFSMDYLVQSNKRVAGKSVPAGELIDAEGRRILVIGGGDTGADCVGTANRQKASCVMQIEVMPKPPECRTDEFSWPKHPLLLKTSTSHEEGSGRKWAILTKKFIGQNNRVQKVSCVQVEFVKENNPSCPAMREVKGSEFEIEADLVILAIGFLHPEHNGLLEELGVSLDKRGNCQAGDNFTTSKKGIFCAGDMHRGQSLIVWAISEGRKAAYCIDKYLMGESSLPIL